MNMDELIEVKLPKEQYELLKQMVKEREAYNLITNKLKNWFLWTVVGGFMTVFSFWEQIKLYFVKVIS